MRPKEFFDILRMQKQRLSATCGADFIVVLEDEFKSFKRYLKGSTAAMETAMKYSNGVCAAGNVFGKAWVSFKSRF